MTLIGKDNNGERNEDDFVAHDVENVTTGRGGDTIDADDNLKGEVKCGAGADLVTADPDDRVASDCENVQVSRSGDALHGFQDHRADVALWCDPGARLLCGNGQGHPAASVRGPGARRWQAQGAEDREQVVLAQGGSTQDHHRQGLEAVPPPDPAQEAAERAGPGLRQDTGAEVGAREQQRLHREGPGGRRGDRASFAILSSSLVAAVAMAISAAPAAAQDATVTVTKDVVPGASIDDFSFSTTGAGLVDFKLDDDGTNQTGGPVGALNEFSNTRTFTISPAQAGPHSITEERISGWNNSAASCSEGTSSGRTVSFTVDPGDTITCEFRNELSETDIQVQDFSIERSTEQAGAHPVADIRMRFCNDGVPIEHVTGAGSRSGSAQPSPTGCQLTTFRSA